ncbi:MAG: PilZ domain-containing protein [Phycisphaerales bacterium]
MELPTGPTPPAHDQPLNPRRRVFARWPFAQQLVPVRDLASRSREIFPMTCRNLSANGIGLVSAREVAIGRPVSITLRSIIRGAVDVRGRVVRCEPTGERRYDVAIALELPLEVREFAPPDPLSNQTIHEAVDPGSIRGTCLIVSSSAGDRAALARTLRATRMVVTSVASVSGARDVPGADIAIITCNDDDDEPGSVLLDLYDQGFAGKAVLVAPDRSSRVRRIVDKLPLAGVIVKPLEDTVLLRVLADIGPGGGAQHFRDVA